MIYYIPLFIIYFLLGLGELNNIIRIKNRKAYTFCLILPIFIMVALRSENMGNDTLSYLNAYTNISELGSLNELLLYSIASYLEPGYLLLNYLFGKIGMSFLMFQISITVYIYLSFFVFIKRYAPNIGLCVCVLMASNMGGTMNVVRMYLALSTLLFAVPFLLSRKWMRFYIIVVIAATFHTSSLIFAMMYPLCSIKYDKKKLALLVIGAGVIAYLGLSFFSWLTNSIGMYDNYLTEDRFQNMNMTAVLIDFIVVILYYICAKKSGLFRIPQYEVKNMTMDKPNISFEYYLHMALLVSLCFSIVGLSNNIMSRISTYFSFAMPFVLATSLYGFRSPFLRMLIYLVFITFHISWFFAVLVLRPEWNCINPYEWGI